MVEFTHLDEQGQARMVDVSSKENTTRFAEATATVYLKKEVLHAIEQQNIAKGDVLSVARVAGIMAAKRTSELIPLCHPLSLSAVELKFTCEAEGIYITSRVKTTGPTGVEMEALSAVSVAALTIYDMCKALDRKICISDIRLLIKRGGKSGDFNHDSEAL